MQKLNADEAQGAMDISIYDLYAPAIFVYAYQQLGHQQDAEDVLLEVFVAALSSQRFTDLSDGEQLAWLRKVARNKVVDRYRRSSLVQMAPLEELAEVEDEGLTPEQQAEQREQYAQLYRSVRQLSTEQQELIRLRYGHGLLLVEIAGLLNKPEGTVRKFLLRTLRRLRICYEQEGREKR
jgi:RNA polymerase sigma factor (sigma-70 family)